MEDLARVLTQCNSTDNDLRHEAEQIRDNLFANQTQEFLILLINLICADIDHTLRSYCIVILLSICKRQINALNPETTPQIWTAFKNNIVGLLTSNKIDKHYKGILCSIDAYLNAHIHRLGADSGFDINQVIMGLAQNIPAEFILTIVSETIEASDDLCNFSAELLMQLLQNSNAYPTETVLLYFCIISKVPESPELLQYFEIVKQLIAQSDVAKCFRIICTFCEKDSPFLNNLIIPLTSFVKENILAFTDEQVMTQGLYILYSIVQYSTEVARTTPDFCNDLCEVFVKVLNTSEMPDVDDYSPASVAQQLVRPITFLIYKEIEGPVTEIIKSIFTNGDTTYKFGLLCFISQSHPLLFTLNYNKFILKSILPELTQVTEPKLQCVILKLLSIYSPMPAHFKAQELQIDLAEFMNLNMSIVQQDMAEEFQIIKYWALKTIHNLVAEAYINHHSEIKDSVPEIIERILQVLENDSITTEKTVAFAIKLFTRCLIKALEPADIESVMNTYSELFAKYEETDKVKTAIVYGMAEYLKELNSSIISNREQETYGNILEQVPEYAKSAYDTCNAMIAQEGISPKRVMELNKAMSILVNLLGDYINEYAGDLLSNCLTILQQPLEFKDVPKTEYLDLNAFYSVENIPGAFRFIIEKESIEVVVNAIQTLTTLLNTQQDFMRLMADNSALLNQILTISYGFIEQQYFVDTLVNETFILLYKVYECIDGNFPVEETETRNELLKTLLVKYFQLTAQLLNMPWTPICLNKFVDHWNLFITVQKINLTEFEDVIPMFFTYCVKLTQMWFHVVEIYYSKQTSEEDIGNYDFFEETQITYIDEALSLFKRLAKQAPDYVVPQFKEQIWPTIHQYIQNQQVKQLTIKFLLLFMSWDQSGVVYNELFPILNEMLHYRPVNEVKERETETEDYFQHLTPVDRPLGVMFENAYEYLWYVIKKLPLPVDTAYTLCNLLVELFNDEILQTAARDDRLREDIILLYTKYLVWINEENYEDHMHIIIEVIPQYGWDSAHPWFMLMFFNTFMKKFFPYICDEVHEANSPTTFECLFASCMCINLQNVDTSKQSYRKALMGFLYLRAMLPKFGEAFANFYEMAKYDVKNNRFEADDRLMDQKLLYDNFFNFLKILQRAAKQFQEENKQKQENQ